MTRRQQAIRKFILLLTLAPLAIAFNNCSRYQSVEMQSVAASLGEQTMDGSVPTPASEGKALYQRTCASCHQSLSVSTKIGRSPTDISNAIRDQLAMSNLSYLTAKDLELLAAALAPNTSAPVTKSVTDYRPTASNRFALASTLQELFVADTAPNADDTAIQSLITNLVTKHPEAFGGNCSRNDRDCSTACGTDAACQGRLNASQIAEPVPTVGTTRKAYMIQACEQILSRDRAIQNLLSKAAIDSSVAPNSTTISNLLKFVSPGRTPSPTSVSALIAVASKGSAESLNALEQWRFVALPICQSNAIDLL